MPISLINYKHNTEATGIGWSTLFSLGKLGFDVLNLLLRVVNASTHGPLLLCCHFPFKLYAFRKAQGRAE